ncbi:MAG: CHRD domain-containing protein [Opitutaceae bacterium]|nr:CHRD domain-containing protein [Opitutaceae bacterium]
MKSTTPVRGLLFVGALCASAVSSWSQVIELRATLNAAQEAPPNTSPATGSAILFYDVAANKFDLVVSISNMTNLATNSHIHEAAPGVAGGVVTGLGGESVYTRNGSNLTATFRDITHGGDKLKLIQGGAYLNIHSAQYPGGEIRGQLIARPVRLVANMDVAQKQAAFPNATGLAALNDFGGAVMLYDPAAHTMRLRMSLFNFNNTFSNSHFHVGAPGVSGGTTVSLGNNANAGGYNNTNGYIAGTFDIPMGTTDPITLLTGGMYLNFHSAGTFSSGELRGQVRVSAEVPSTRVANTSVRGLVGTGDQVLIHGFHITGAEPVRVLISAKGPSLTSFGVTGVLANPVLTLYDSRGRPIASNDNFGTVPTGSELVGVPGLPTNANEAALVVVLPPGSYTASVSAAAGTGVALLEITDLRLLGPAFTATAD